MPDHDSLFIIVRHGNTFEAGEPARRVGARTDLPLTVRGQEQGAALGAHFAAQGLRFGRVLVSPLMRTQQTAAAILAAQGVPPHTENAAFLREVDHGPDENQPEHAVLARIGAAALAAWDRAAKAPPGWTVDANARIAAWHDLFDNAVPGQLPTLLVTSNGAARFALIALGVSPESGLKLATGSFGVIRKAADGTFLVPVWGERP